MPVKQLASGRVNCSPCGLHPDHSCQRAPALGVRVIEELVRSNRGNGTLMNKYVTEAIGTFFLVLTIGCTVIGGSPG